LPGTCSGARAGLTHGRVDHIADIFNLNSIWVESHLHLKGALVIDNTLSPEVIARLIDGDLIEVTYRKAEVRALGPTEMIDDPAPTLGGDGEPSSPSQCRVKLLVGRTATSINYGLSDHGDLGERNGSAFGVEDQAAQNIGLLAANTRRGGGARTEQHEETHDERSVTQELQETT